MAMKKSLARILGLAITLGLLASLLLTAAPVSAVTQPSVVLTDGPTGNPAYVISKDNIYTVTFTTGAKVLANQKIVVVFEAGTNLNNITEANVKIDTTAGLGGTAFTDVTPFDAVATGTYPVEQTLTITPSSSLIIGNGAIVQLTIGSTAGAGVYVTNPTTPGVYNLTVATQTAAAVVIEAAVTSADYTIKVPTISPVPGVVWGYNANDILLYEDTGDTAINAAFAVSGVTKVVVGPGTYDEDVALTVATITSITSLDGAATTIIKDADASTAGGTVTLSVKTTFDGFTVVGRTFGVKVDSVAGTTVKNCVLSGATLGALDIDVGTLALPTISTGNTITVATADHGINLAASTYATSTNDIFTVTGTGTGIINNGTLTLTGATINGASGIGFQSLATAAASTITGTTFSGLDTAILVTDGTTVAVSSSTITGCGRAAVISPAVTALPAIDIDGAADVRITGNTISSNNEAVLLDVAVAVDAALVQVMFNDILDNAGDADGLLINNNDTTADLNCIKNWWGDPDGPGAAAFSDDVLSAPFLAASAGDTGVIGTNVAVNTLWDERTTVGVTLQADQVMEIVGAAQYAANPAAAVDGTALGFWDVCVIDTDDDVTSVTIRLYLPGVTADTEAYVWATARGEWLECSDYTPNLFGSFMAIVVTDLTTPTIDDLGELPFVVVEPPVSALTQPVVTLSDDVIGKTANYTIYFTISEDVAEGEDIIVEFPTDTDISGITDIDTHSDVTVAATSGIGSTTFNATAASSSSADTTLTITVPDVNAEDKIGAGATVQVVVSGVVNPSTAGSYPLTVATSQETTAVTSAAYTITPPEPADFTTSDLTIYPTQADIGEPIVIEVVVTNTGDLSGSYEVTLELDNVAVGTMRVSLAGGAYKVVEFIVTPDVAKSYSVVVNGLSDSFTVTEPLPPGDDFAIFLEVNDIDIQQQDTIAFDEAGQLRIGIRISDVKRQVVLESIAVEATLAGQIVASVSESLEGVLLAVGDDYENTITLGEDKPMSFGLLGRINGIFLGRVILTYSLPDGSRPEWTVSKPIRIPGNPIGTAAGQAAAGMAVVSVIAASWLFTSAASSTIAASVSVPGNAVAELGSKLRPKLSDWVHGKLGEKARGGVRSLIMKTVNSRMPKDKCPWCETPLKHDYCQKCKKSAEQARREYIEHVSELASRAAGLIEDARRPITLQEIQSGLNIIDADKTVGDVLVALNNVRLIRLTGIGGRKLARWALGLGIILGLGAVLWVTVGGWAALPTWALLATIGGSAAVPWAVTKGLEARRKRG